MIDICWVKYNNTKSVSLCFNTLGDSVFELARGGEQKNGPPLLIVFVFLCALTILLHRNTRGRWIYLNISLSITFALLYTFVNIYKIIIYEYKEWRINVILNNYYSLPLLFFKFWNIEQKQPYDIGLEYYLVPEHFSIA